MFVAIQRLPNGCDLSIGTGIAASTLYRLLITLQRRGLVEFDETTQTWAIGIETFRIGSALRRLVANSPKHENLLGAHIMQLHESRWRTQITIEPEEPVKK